MKPILMVSLPLQESPFFKINLTSIQPPSVNHYLQQHSSGLPLVNGLVPAAASSVPPIQTLSLFEETYADPVHPWIHTGIQVEWKRGRENTAKEKHQPHHSMRPETCATPRVPACFQPLITPRVSGRGLQTCLSLRGIAHHRRHQTPCHASRVCIA